MYKVLFLLLLASFHTFESSAARHSRTAKTTKTVARFGRTTPVKRFNCTAHTAWPVENETTSILFATS